jgi:hypothetical protein
VTLRAARTPRLRQYAYVAGCAGPCLEHELALGQGFKKHYDRPSSSRVWVRSMLDRLPVTIHRPAIVVGTPRAARPRVRRPLLRLRAVASGACGSGSPSPVRRTRRALTSAGRLRGQPLVAPGTTRERRQDAAPRRPEPTVRRVARRAPRTGVRGQITGLPAALETRAKSLRIPPVRRLLGDVHRSRSSTSTTPCASTPGRRARCSSHRACAARRSRTT